MSSMAWMSSRLAMPLTCVARRRAVESLGIVAARLPRVVEPLYTVATYCEWVAGLCCAGVILQSACPHVLLAFNTPPAASLAGAHHRPCHVVPWKICTCPNEDHDCHIARGYFFTLMAHSP
jgi:hypothetical protein